MSLDASESLRLDAVLGADGLATLAKQLAGQIQKDAKPKARIQSMAMLERAVGDKLAGALHIDVLGLLADGWNKAVELDDCRKRSLQSPQATMIVTLGRHSIARDLKPEIVVSYGAEQHFALDAAIAVAGAFEGVELALQAGEIVSVGSGHCNISVQLKLKGRDIGKAWELKRWALPGEYRFNPPLRLSV